MEGKGRVGWGCNGMVGAVSVITLKILSLIVPMHILFPSSLQTLKGSVHTV